MGESQKGPKLPPGTAQNSRGPGGGSSGPAQPSRHKLGVAFRYGPLRKLEAYLHSLLSHSVGILNTCGQLADRSAKRHSLGGFIIAPVRETCWSPYVAVHTVLSV